MALQFRLLLFLLLTATPGLAATYVFDYNTRCHSAYQQYMSLNLSRGTALIRQELTANPYNLMATYLADYEDCLLLLMNGDPADYQQRQGHLQERLKLLANGDDRSPWFRLSKAGVHFHWALVYIRFGENLKAATSFRRSFLLLKENNRLFPGFPQNKIFLGVEEAVVGTIPEDYQWLASIFGMKGSVRKGISLLTEFLNESEPGAPLRNEAVIYSCYLRYYLMSQQDAVWKYVNSSQFPVENNLFHTFVKANLALNNRKADAAIQVLRQAQSQEGFKQLPILDYELGTALLHKLDDDAILYFNRFLSRYKGRFFVKDTYQKLAFLYYIRSDQPRANYYRQMAVKAGNRITDADKQAQRFAEGKAWPAAAVLKARLLSDGGYQQQALQLLQATDPKPLNMTDKLEYYFRLARIYEELKDEPKAVQLYQHTITLGRSRPEHFAARSSLQLGMLHERLGKTSEAIRCYHDCLSMKHHDFQANIDQQAKAGLNRLTGK